MGAVIAIAAGFVLDLVFGDPPGFPHPVRLMGRAISAGERPVRRLAGESAARLVFGGAVLSVLLVAASFALPFCLLRAAGLVGPWLKTALEAFFCYQILAVKSLKTESMGVYAALSGGDIKLARARLSRIVGRDTADLSEEKIARAAVETVAENTSDGAVAPLLFMAIGGAPLGFAYKAVNTLDSMIGYKDARRLYFGRFAARLDDAANFIPAIITGRLMIAASFITGLDHKNALRVYKRDKHKHPSPNSGKPEAACAGALGIRLGGPSAYSGKTVEKPYIGDDARPAAPGDIIRANRLMLAASVLALVIFLAIRLGVSLLI